jgi:hypothetical protein
MDWHPEIFIFSKFGFVDKTCKVRSEIWEQHAGGLEGEREKEGGKGRARKQLIVSTVKKRMPRRWLEEGEEGRREEGGGRKGERRKGGKERKWWRKGGDIQAWKEVRADSWSKFSRSSSPVSVAVMSKFLIFLLCLHSTRMAAEDC